MKMEDKKHESGLTLLEVMVCTAILGIIVMLAFKFGWTAAAPGLLLISSTFVFIPGDSISTQAYELSMGRWSAGASRWKGGAGFTWPR